MWSSFVPLEKFKLGLTLDSTNRMKTSFDFKMWTSFLTVICRNVFIVVANHRRQRFPVDFLPIASMELLC